jgi:hypothetical protein
MAASSGAIDFALGDPRPSVLTSRCLLLRAAISDRSPASQQPGRLARWASWLAARDGFIPERSYTDVVIGAQLAFRGPAGFTKRKDERARDTAETCGVRGVAAG